MRFSETRAGNETHSQKHDGNENNENVTHSTQFDQNML